MSCYVTDLWIDRGVLEQKEKREYLFLFSEAKEILFSASSALDILDFKGEID
jgi:hypothetical protein